MLLKAGFTEEQLESADIRKAVGCDVCNDGYKGRVGVYEVVRVTPSIAQLILAQGNAMEISKQARLEGFPDLHQSALVKVLKGMTSLEEVSRVTTD